MAWEHIRKTASEEIRDAVNDIREVETQDLPYLRSVMERHNFREILRAHSDIVVKLRQAKQTFRYHSVIYDPILDTIRTEYVDKTNRIGAELDALVNEYGHKLTREMEQNRIAGMQ